MSFVQIHRLVDLMLNPAKIGRVLLAARHLARVKRDLASRSLALILGDLNETSQSLKPPTTELADQWFEAVRLAARMRGDQEACLPKSIALTRILQRREMPAKLHLGVVPRKEQLRAHAWVQLGQTVVGETAAEVAEFVRLPLDQWEGVAARELPREDKNVTLE